MSTYYRFNPDPSNIDYLIREVRLHFGDLDGSLFQDMIVRGAILSAIKQLAPRWSNKYIVYNPVLKAFPQPVETPVGYLAIATNLGIAYVPDSIKEDIVIRNPFVAFPAANGFIDQIDEQAIILMATIILRKSQLASSADSFLSIATEDLKYSSLGSERTLSGLLQNDLDALQLLFRTKIARPQLLQFAIHQIIMVTRDQLDLALNPLNVNITERQRYGE